MLSCHSSLCLALLKSVEFFNDIADLAHGMWSRLSIGRSAVVVVEEWCVSMAHGTEAINDATLYLALYATVAQRPNLDQ
jgi:hypothetical protein